MYLKTAGIEFEVTLKGPEDADKAVLIVHDWWGMLAYNEEWAERFAGLGFRAMVVDLYDGAIADNPQHAGELMRAIDQDEADAKLTKALEVLAEGGRKVLTLGWSLGGRQALHAALLDPEHVVGSVVFYSRMPTNPEELVQLPGPVLAIYAETERNWPEKMHAFDAAMAEAGKPVESHSYKADHGFVNPGSRHYNADAASASWEEVKGFVERLFA